MGAVCGSPHREAPATAYPPPHTCSHLGCLLVLSDREFEHWCVLFSLQVGDFSGVGMTDTPPSDCPTQGAEFDMMSALDWKDGIATLPGSDIRVRNKFAILPAFVPMRS